MQDRSHHHCHPPQRIRALRLLMAIAGLSMPFAFSGPAFSNDSMAAIGAGGIRLIESDALRMEREELNISVDEVRVKYTFRNLTNYPFTGTVAFPIPDLDMYEFSESPNHSTGKADDIVDFHVRVNGEDIKPTYTANALNTDGQDVTALLRFYKVPVTNSMDNEIDQALHKMAPEETKVLLNADALHDADHAGWIARSIYHWEQTFPPQTPIIVEHWYKPFAGYGLIGTVDTDTILNHQLYPDWCPDKSFVNGIRKLRRIDSDYVPYRSVEYVLKTGANWAGPIGHFRLELDKGAAALLSTCPIPGLDLKKSGNKFIAETDNFTPATDLKLLFVYDRPR